MLHDKWSNCTDGFITSSDNDKHMPQISLYDMIL